MKSLNDFLNLYRVKGKNQRLGQCLCNEYDIEEEEIEGLFYEENEIKAKNMIRYWLMENCYTDFIPTLSEKKKKKGR